MATEDMREREWRTLKHPETGKVIWVEADYVSQLLAQRDDAEATAEKLREQLEASNQEARDGAKAAYHWMSHATALGEALRELCEALEATTIVGVRRGKSRVSEAWEVARQVLSDSDSNTEGER